MKKLKRLSPKKLDRSGNKKSITTSCRWFEKLTIVLKYAFLYFSKLLMVNIMGSDKRSQDKNIFESDFDFWELDDGFLMKIESDLKKNETKERHTKMYNNFNSKVEKTSCNEKMLGKKKINAKCDHYGLPLFIEDFNESSFFDLSQNKNEKLSPKTTNQKNGKIKKDLISYQSLIQSPKLNNKTGISSSTPAKQGDSDVGEKQKTSQQNSIKNFYFDFSEADLFDDWNLDETNKENTKKETVTFSQALKLIEEAELAMETNGATLNQSIDLLTGDVVNSDMGGMFEESFGLPESTNTKFSSNSAVIDHIKTECKPSARKLEFASEQVDICNSADLKGNQCFNSDDDFDFLTQDLLKKPTVSNFQKNYSHSPDSPKTEKSKPLRNNLNDSIDAITGLKKKRGKCFQIIESDEDSPSPKFQRQNKMKKRKNPEENFGNEFIDLEAEVSDEAEVSSDETEEEGEYDKSFLDEESYFSENYLANMTAKYLESVKTVTRHGSFKIPEPKPYNSANVFSQIPEENNTDYEIDSFCVNDVEEEMKTDLSDLEVAEKILEMDRKKRKKKRNRKIKK